MLRRRNVVENPLDYPHRSGDNVVNLKTEKQGKVIDDSALIQKHGPWVLVKYDDCEKIEDIRDIANKGNIVE